MSKFVKGSKLDLLGEVKGMKANFRNRHTISECPVTL